MTTETMPDEIFIVDNGKANQAGMWAAKALHKFKGHHRYIRADLIDPTTLAAIDETLACFADGNGVSLANHSLQGVKGGLTVGQLREMRRVLGGGR